jgi:demethylmenaquinone methyltransferase/2-methoxy-6-polyprenyl-1,4-benzoquinol methylase
VSKADLAKKPAEVAAMFDDVAPTYDLTNDLLSFGQSRIWRHSVKRAVAPKSGQSILDLAAGTGSSSIVFTGPNIRVVASDFSKGMLEVGKKRHPQLEFVFADATKLPFAAEEFDAVTISFGLRNVVDVEAALAQMFRVLKPGGRVVICEFSKVTNPLIRGLYNFYLSKFLPKFSSLASKTPEAYDYLAESILAWPDQPSLAKKIEAAGFEQVSWKNLSLGIVALHVGYKPARKAKH